MYVHMYIIYVQISPFPLSSLGSDGSEVSTAASSSNKVGAFLLRVRTGLAGRGVEGRLRW